MARITFSNADTRAVFADKDYNEFSQLMFDTAMNTLKDGLTKATANDKIREVMFEVLGVDPKCSRKELNKAIRRHKTDVFEVIEETVENLLKTGWGENPFFNQFVEIRNLEDGDTNEFYAPDDVILTVAELAGNHHDLFRQRVGEGTPYSIKTSWYGLKIYTEYELFMAGRIDWAAFVMKVYEAMDKKVNDMVYTSLMSIADVTASTQFNKTGALDHDTLIELIEDIEAATGDEVVIMGTRAALSKLDSVGTAGWVSDDMRNERYTTGRLGYWEGVRKVEIPQAFAPGGTTTKLVDSTKLLFMPLGDNRFIKVVNEGDARVTEITDMATRVDMTMEYEYQQKMGVATIVGKKFGTWKITA